jgi:TRAP-type mannitol/chloroaromatic compound transport system permease small subunit
MRSLIRAIDSFSRWCGVLAAILVVVLIVLMLYDVTMRYVFNAPTLWGFDINTWLMGAAFVLSIGYALSHDAHVRVDLLYTDETRGRMRWVDLFGFIILLLPIAAWITWGLWHYAIEAIRTGERSGTSAWNPVLWPFRLILFLGFLAFTVQIVGEVIKRIYGLQGQDVGTGRHGVDHDKV